MSARAAQQVLDDDDPPATGEHPQQFGQAGVWVHPVVERGDGPRHGESVVLEGDVLGRTETDVGGWETAPALADEARRRVHPGEL